MTTSLPRTISEASRLIEARELSPVELVRALFDRIDAIDPVISSFLTVTRDEAHAQARKIDEAALLSARLYPDMFTLTRQVQLATDTARSGSACFCRS